MFNPYMNNQMQNNTGIAGGGFGGTMPRRIGGPTTRGIQPPIVRNQRGQQLQSMQRGGGMPGGNMLPGNRGGMTPSYSGPNVDPRMAKLFDTGGFDWLGANF